MTEQDVTSDSSPTEGETDVNNEVTATESHEEEKGTKTPPENLYNALQEERKLRKEQSEEIKELRTQLETLTSASSGDPDEDAARKIGALEKKLETLEDERRLDRVVAQYPALADKRAEFEEFSKEYPKHKADVVAKLFLAENDLLESKAPRKGLEKKTGGTQAAAQTGLTLEDVDELRKTNYKKYLEDLSAGKFDHIK